ncbi:MAG: Unknown protein [uncultured Sulfurovum sp.]|uniref:Lipoprotein n=1 Tax=uncultured Sulfurovum sp. TaxID=269237 RepID=A0A6S6RXM2_9BACT|nr:MAG: Unknown protein [uncultured Sulfurovum sp.]
MKNNDFKLILLLLIGAVLLGGCNHKYFRTKPTTYININAEGGSNVSIYSRLLLKLYCIKSDENMTVSDDIGKCEDYTIADVSNLSTIHITSKKNKAELRAMANDLFYIADNNCKKFQEKFFYNNLIDDTANQFVGLNLFGASFGIDFKGILKLSHSQFEVFNENLAKNLKDRAEVKQSIENNISKGQNYTNEELLVDIINYDKACSLFRVKDLEVK